MDAALIIWCLSFLLVAVLLGITMYGLICLSDLEHDFINPHDASTRVNQFALPELGIQAALTVLYLVTWKWFLLLYNAPMLAYHAHVYMRGEHMVHVTEIFSQLSQRKKVFLVKLFFYLIFFVIVIYSLVKAAVALAIADDDF